MSKSVQSTDCQLEEHSPVWPEGGMPRSLSTSHRTGGSSAFLRAGQVLDLEYRLQGSHSSEASVMRLKSRVRKVLSS